MVIPPLLDEWAVMAVAGLTVYLGTNLDNLVLLTALAGTRPDGPSQGRSAVFVVAGIVMGAALALGHVLSAVPVGVMNRLGFVPLGLGLWMAGRAIMMRGSDGAGRLPRGSLVLLLLFGSSDTIAALTPLLAETVMGLRLPLLSGVALGAVLLAGGLNWTLTRPALRRALERHGRWIAPLVMILAGLYMLADTGTDTV